MVKYGLYTIFTLTLAFSIFTWNAIADDNHAEHEETIHDIAPLAVSCSEDEAIETNSIECDMSKFIPDCVKISLSNNPNINWKSFDFARHNIVILKEEVPFDEKAVSFDVTGEQRDNFPADFPYNFETGEFLGRPRGELRNREEPIVSLVNSGPGVYNIWCRYHFLSGMTMKLFVVE